MARKLVKKPDGYSERNLQKFCRLIAAGYSQSAALREAFPITKKWEPQSVWVRASALANRDKVRIRIDELKKEYYANLGISEQRVLKERARLAFYDPGKLFDEDGSPKHVADLDDDTRAAITGYEVAKMFEGHGEERTYIGDMHKIKLADKSKSLEALEKHLGIYNEKQQTDAVFNIVMHV